MKNHQYVKEFVHDASGVDNPNLYLWEIKSGIYYPAMLQFTEIVIGYYIDSFNQLSRITLIKDGVIEYCEPFEIKHHSEYLNLAITRFEQIN